MDYISLLKLAIKILRRNKIVWLVSLVNPLYSVLLSLSRRIPALNCIAIFVGFYLIIVGYLGVVLILAHGYHGQTVNIKGLWTEINLYLKKEFVMVFLLIIPLIIPGLFLIQLVRGLSYIVYQASLSIPIFFFYTFFLHYLVLGAIENRRSIKYAAQVWMINLDAKLAISISYIAVYILFNLLLVASQHGLSAGLLEISSKDVQAIINLPVPWTLLLIFRFVISPIIGAVVVSLYFKDVEEKEGSMQVVSQLD